MKWIFYNPNPYGNNTGDCVIRALTLAFGKNWDDVYSMLAEFGFKNKLMPSSNENWPALGKTLRACLLVAFRESSIAKLWLIMVRAMLLSSCVRF